ncbi:MAG: Do family serine endopeptidase [Bacteroidales bacterium]|nr:Do family serine endopeptidase [Bacteroidales bacterium]
MKKYLGSFLSAMAGGLVFLLLYMMISERGGERSDSALYQEPAPVVQTGYTPAMPVIGPDFVEAADKTVHAVVHIKSELASRNQTYNDFFDLFNEFFGNPYRGYNEPAIATGSGVIISSDGYIVTNNHVVQQASRLEVTLNDKRSYEAKIIGTDPTTDLALIRIEEAGLPYLSYGNSDDLKIGEWVLAVGNPFNLTSTVTAGIVSAKARNINILGNRSAIESFIQTDAVVNRGNSGGALVNVNGELVGVNAAIASNTGSYTGYSFAIPVNIVRKVMDDFLSYGDIQRAYLGITFVEVDSRFAGEKGLKDVRGVYIMETVENGAADEAGMRPGDVIVRVNDVTINSKSALLESIGTHRPGDRIRVTAERDGKTREFEVVLKDISGGTEPSKKDVFQLLGATFEPLPESEMVQLGITHGMKVTRLESGKLQSAGVREGFIIMDVDEVAIRSFDDLQYALSGKRGGVLIEGIYPNGQKAYYGIGL